MTDPRITVAICTWNRAAALRATLEAMTGLIVPPGLAWELLVVNNNGTDDTDAVVDGFAARLPVRRTFEPTPGKSHALNRACREVRGTYIVWADDDVTPDPGWLAAYAAAFDAHPEAALFGGPIAIHFETPPPAWLAAGLGHVAHVLGRCDYGAAEIPLAPERLPYGANMAVRRADQARMLYDPSLGPRAGRYSNGEETAMMQALLASGATGWWVPAARVHHRLDRSAMTPAYLRRRFVGQGERVALTAAAEAPGRRLFGRPLWLWRQALGAELRYRLGRPVLSAERWVRSLALAGESWGLLRAWGRGAEA